METNKKITTLLTVQELTEQFYNVLKEGNHTKIMNELVVIKDYTDIEKVKGNLPQDFNQQFLSAFIEKLQNDNENSHSVDFVRNRIVDVFSGQYEIALNPKSYQRKEMALKELSAEVNDERIKKALDGFDLDKYVSQFVSEYKTCTQGVPYLVVAENFIEDLNHRLNPLKSGESYQAALELKKEFGTKTLKHLDNESNSTYEQIKNKLCYIMAGLDNYKVPSLKNKIQRARPQDAQAEKQTKLQQ